MRQPFVMFGLAHLVAVALAFVLPLLLAFWTRGHARRDRLVRASLALLLASGWVCWYLLFWARGWFSLGNALPLNLCDWAALALIAALMTRNQLAYELGYFWGLGGTLQGLATPDIGFGFPDPQFLFFFIQHSGVIAALLYLTLGTQLRPWPSSLPRVVGATLVYVAVAGIADWLLDVDYGFLRAKPHNPSLLDLMAPWPWYIPELVLTGIASLLVYYLPFALVDLTRPYRRQGRGPSSRRTSGNAPSL